MRTHSTNRKQELQKRDCVDSAEEILIGLNMIMKYGSSYCSGNTVLCVLKKNWKAFRVTKKIEGPSNGIEKEWGIKKSSFVASLKSPTN